MSFPTLSEEKQMLWECAGFSPSSGKCNSKKTQKHRFQWTVTHVFLSLVKAIEEKPSPHWNSDTPPTCVLILWQWHTTSPHTALTGTVWFLPLDASSLCIWAPITVSLTSWPEKGSFTGAWYTRMYVIYMQLLFLIATELSKPKD